MVAAILGVPVLSLANQTTFSCTGFPQYFVVPPGVVSLSVTVTGGAGGAGGIVTANLAVTPKQVLTMNVGCQPFAPSQSNPKRSHFAGFGFANGGNGAPDTTGQFQSAAGGGATAILKPDGTILIVAGGGGGAGEQGAVTSFNGAGGNGGDGGSRATGNGSDGGSTFGVPGGVGGDFAGSSTAAGTNGPSGHPGSGGAGGGGYPHGGAAGGLSAAGASGNGGGGGGGQSYTDPSISAFFSVAQRSTSNATPDDGSIVINFDGNPFQQVTLAQCTGATQSYAIPIGTTSLHVVAIGASGGSANTSYWLNFETWTIYGALPGTGSGAQTDIPAADFPATRQLSVAVGCQGGQGQQASWFSSTAAGAIGGFGIYPGGNGGNGDKLSGTQPADGASGGGGGGGGASGVTYTGIVVIPLITAGGGGGAGAYGNFFGINFAGGKGGNGSMGFVSVMNGDDGTGNGGGAGGKFTDIVFTRAGGDAFASTNAGGRRRHRHH
jgi:hypothetical protein